jgi:hypothetical protein
VFCTAWTTPSLERGRARSRSAFARSLKRLVASAPLSTLLLKRP